MTFEQMLAQAKQLYNGTQELQRVYNGETMVWNRYNWEKWSCDSKTETIPTYTETTVGFIENVSKTYTTDYIYVAYWVKSKGKFWGIKSHPGKTLEELAGMGYQYAYFIYGGEHAMMIKYDLRTLVDDKYASYHVALTEGSTTTTTYSKGTTQYADVNGLKGDYPANGRASDGYWYVAKGAVYFGGS